MSLRLALLLAFPAAPLRAAGPVVLPRAVTFSVEPAGAVIPMIQTPEAVGLGDVRWWNNYARAADGEPLESLGRGQQGAAYVHPADDSLMVKIAAVGYGNAISRSRRDMEIDILEEAEAARLLADAGAGPRPIAVTRIRHRLQPLLERMAGWFGVPAPDWSQPALVKEKVVGRTVSRLRRDGEFTDDHAEMVRELKDRIRDAGLTATDLHDENIVIGTTASAPRPRAHLIDAGYVR